MSESETILACPECGFGGVSMNRSRGAVNDASRYRCNRCNETFDDPDTKERNPSGHGQPTRGLAAKLAKIGEESNS